MNLRFELHADGCCMLCNPVSLADHEQRCVRVTLVGSVVPAREFCSRCIGWLAAVMVKPDDQPPFEPIQLAIPKDVARLVRAKK